MSTQTESRKVESAAKLAWIPLRNLKVSSRAQREYKQTRVDKLVAEFDPEQIGYPTVNRRSGGEGYYVCDGQHRIEALKLWLGEGWEDQQVRVRLYEGLTESEEAEVFLAINNYLAVSTMSKFKVAVTAGRTRECEINKVVEANGLSVGTNGAGVVRCVATLAKIYDKYGTDILGRALRVSYAAFGNYGLDSHLLEAMSLVFQRYEGKLNEETVVRRLRNMSGHLNALMTRAEHVRAQMGVHKANAIAASIVTTLNAGHGGAKLPGWWATS